MKYNPNKIRTYEYLIKKNVPQIDVKALQETPLRRTLVASLRESRNK